MPRMSREEKARTHARIVEVAAAMFRENGIAATGIADVMKAAGLTHGGFYRHFASKEALTAAAIAHAVSNSLADLVDADAPDARRAALERYIARYLSDEHVDNPQLGCPLAALGPEAPRAAAPISTALDNGSAEAVRILAEAMGGRKEDATTLMATLLGSVIMARMATSEADRRQILSAGRKAAQKIVKTAEDRG